MTAAGFRYGGVLGLTLTLVIFSIVAAEGRGSRAVVLALEGGALLIVVATSSDRRSVRRARVRVLVMLGLVVMALVVTGVLSPEMLLAVSLTLGVAILVALARGLRRLVQRHGVTLQVVAGALGIYLVIGLMFGWLVRLLALLGSGGYFAGAGDVPTGQGIYYSFTVLTTTGFGDLVPARPVGRALGVVEMLVGQIYLVTVIGVIIGDLTRSRRPPPTAAQA